LSCAHSLSWDHIVAGILFHPCAPGSDRPLPAVICQVLRIGTILSRCYLKEFDVNSGNVHHKDVRKDPN
jgi:hypothetical protein